jgi:hypothetical protein
MGGRGNSLPFLFMQFFTYRVTFPGFPWFYFGWHKENGKPYFGSPKTHKWIWEFYEYEIQILEWFDTQEKAQELEKRLIRPFLNDNNCLNEHCGGGFSFESSSRGGRKAVLKLQEWWRNAPPDVLKQKQQRSRESGRKSGQIHIDSGHASIFHTYRDPKERSEWGKEFARITNSTKAQCPCCGRISNLGGMTRHLKGKSNTCFGEMVILKSWNGPFEET